MKKIKFNLIAKLALASFPLFVLAGSILPIKPVTPKAIALTPITISQNETSLTGTWRATDSAVKEMYDKVYQGNPPDQITGDMLFVFENTGGLKLIYDDVTLSFDGIPPTTLVGEMEFIWQTPQANSFSTDPQSYELQAKTLGITIPVPENMVPSVKSTYGYKIEGNTLKLTVPEDVYLPLEWERL